MDEYCGECGGAVNAHGYCFSCGGYAFNQDGLETDVCEQAPENEMNNSKDNDFKPAKEQAAALRKAEAWAFSDDPSPTSIFTNQQRILGQMGELLIAECMPLFEMCMRKRLNQFIKEYSDSERVNQDEQNK